MTSDDELPQADQPAADLETPPGSTRPLSSPDGRTLTTSPASRTTRPGLAIAAALAVVAFAAAALLTGTRAFSAAEAGTTSPPAAEQPSATGPVATEPAIVGARPVTAAQLAALPESTTNTTVPGAPADPAPAAHTDGRIAQPTARVPVYAAPGGPAIATLPPTMSFGQAVTATSVPIIAEQPGWAQVLLPSRPNGSTGWITTGDGAPVVISHTGYRIDVDRATLTLTLYDGAATVGHWPISDGKATAITPPGRTFVLSSIAEQNPTYSPVILPLGTHSPVHTTFGGGPGTVGLHGWTPDDTVFGKAASDGCVRVPRDALDAITSNVPLGTVVEIA